MKKLLIILILVAVAFTTAVSVRTTEAAPDAQAVPREVVLFVPEAFSQDCILTVVYHWYSDNSENNSLWIYQQTNTLQGGAYCEPLINKTITGSNVPEPSFEEPKSNNPYDSLSFAVDSLDLTFEFKGEPFKYTKIEYEDLNYYDDTELESVLVSYSLILSEWTVGGNTNEVLPNPDPNSEPKTVTVSFLVGEEFPF